ncbi:MAG TPA: SDR family NAD(P)-dependent oxidoreductase [Gaiellales bacterium]|nr:SDR family NAD(P)-dependent oxidoreductase [Gaiellales bacterium]
MRPAGTVAWVTGASAGIGAALVRELCLRGASVAATARRTEALEQLAAGAPGRVLPVAADVTDLAAMRTAAERIRDELGPIDLAVLNAGLWEQVDVRAFDSEVVRRHMETNIMGMVHGVEAVLPQMRQRRAGTIAGMASVAGYRGLPQAEGYAASKAAQINLLESLRIDLRSSGVRVVTVCPGFVRTRLTGRNSFRMPFMLEPDDAARRICDGLEQGRPEIVFPLSMMLAMKAVRLVPVRTYAWAFSLRRSQRRRG